MILKKENCQLNNYFRIMRLLTQILIVWGFLPKEVGANAFLLGSLYMWVCMCTCVLNFKGVCNYVESIKNSYTMEGMKRNIKVLSNCIFLK